MKNSIRIFRLMFLGLTISTILFSSCKKDRIESQEKQINDYQSMNNYFDTKKQHEQEFIIDTAGTGPIVGNQGTKIYVSKDLLMFPNGDSVHWPYTVKLIELYTPKI